MAQPGDEITFTFSGAKETEDISNVDEVVIRRMDGAGGFGSSSSSLTAAGSGGQIKAARAEVSTDDTLNLTVGGAGGFPSGGFGRSNGGFGGGSTLGDAGGGGGSTEIFTASGLLAAADAGGGGAEDGGVDGGGGGARGGGGGSGQSGDTDGGDGGGSGFGGSGGSTAGSPAGNGGQELASATLLDRGSTGTGSGPTIDGEITVLFDKPLKPLSLSATEDTSGLDPAVDLSWTNDIQRVNNIFRSTVASPTFPADFAEVGSVGKGVTTFTDSPPDFETSFTYRVTASVNGGESDPSAPTTITTSSDGEFVVTITNTNSPVTLGDTLELDVDVENVGDYRADEIIDADLELQ